MAWNGPYVYMNTKETKLFEHFIISHKGYTKVLFMKRVTKPHWI